MLRLLKTRGVLPNKPKDIQEEESKEGYLGAKVIEPPVGIFDNVIALDFNEFYPRLILLYNISPETLDKSGDLRINEQYAYSSVKKGILPTLVKRIIHLKARIKDERSNALYSGNIAQYEVLSTKYEAIKRILNSFYGVSAYWSRLHSKEVAESISTAARKHLSLLIERIPRKKFRILYGDTDSCFVQIGKSSLSDLLNEVSNLVPKGLSLDVKEEFERIIFLSKKRYIGKTKDGRIIRVGLQSIRSDTEQFCTDTLDRVLVGILEKVHVNEIRSYIRQALQSLTNGNVSPDALARPVQLRKQFDQYKARSAHIQATLYSNEHLNARFRPGSKPLIIRIKKVAPGFPNTKWLAFRSGQFPKGFVPDQKYYVKRLKTTLEDVFQILPLTWQQIESRTLEEFSQ